MEKATLGYSRRRSDAVAPANLSLDHLYVIPQLKPVNPCCSYAHDRRFNSVREYAYVLDFTVNNEESFRAKFSTRPRCECYGFGHLRAVRVTALSQGKTSQPFPMNLPITFFPEGLPTVYAEAWFHTDIQLLTEECQTSSPQPQGKSVIQFEDLQATNGSSHFLVADDDESPPIRVKAELLDPRGNLRTVTETLIQWNNQTIQQFVDPRDGRHRDQKGFHGELAHVFALNVGYAEAGLWRVRIYDAGADQPFIYQVPLLFLPSNADTMEMEGLDLLQGSWRLEGVVPIKEKRPLLSSLSGHENHHRSSEELSCRLYEWFVCGGGTVTLTLSFYFTMFCMSSRQRHQHFRQGSVLKTLAVLAFATLLQAALCAFAVGGS